MQLITTVTQKGQVTIPLIFRKKLGILAGSKIAFYADLKVKNSLILKPAPHFSSLKGSFKSRKTYSKAKARKAYLQDVLDNKV